MELNKGKFEVAVIGGGPAGLMAAGWAASAGAKTVLLEKNTALGKKILITGKGRCNITQAHKNLREFIKELGVNGAFLFSALSAFGPKEVIDFFERHGVKTKIERGGRVFPESDSSVDVLNALLKFAEDNSVEIVKGVQIKKFEIKNDQIEKIITQNGEIAADNYIIATGGQSYPQTGCTGDGYVWAKSFGHNIIQPAPALTPIYIKEKWVKELEGLSLKNVSLSVYQNQKKQTERFGEALFTDRGLSGPIVLDVSQTVGALLKKGEVELRLNFKPALDYPTLDKRVQGDLLKSPNKNFKNSLDELLPQKLIPIFIKLSGIPENKKAGQLTKAERAKLVKLLSEFKMSASGLAGFEKAIITCGGVDLKEIDPKTMRSKIIDNLFFAGEIIDLNGPTGGYNLQIAFSTGHLAGVNAANK